MDLLVPLLNALYSEQTFTRLKKTLAYNMQFNAVRFFNESDIALALIRVHTLTS